MYVLVQPLECMTYNSLAGFGLNSSVAMSPNEVWLLCLPIEMALTYNSLAGFGLNSSVAMSPNEVWLLCLPIEMASRECEVHSSRILNVWPATAFLQIWSLTAHAVHMYIFL